jgi:hypothetical protein
MYEYVFLSIATVYKVAHQVGTPSSFVFSSANLWTGHPGHVDFCTYHPRTDLRIMGLLIGPR